MEVIQNYSSNKYDDSKNIGDYILKVFNTFFKVKDIFISLNSVTDCFYNYNDDYLNTYHCT